MKIIDKAKLERNIMWMATKRIFWVWRILFQIKNGFTYKMKVSARRWDGVLVSSVQGTVLLSGTYRFIVQGAGSIVRTLIKCFKIIPGWST